MMTNPIDLIVKKAPDTFKQLEVTLIRLKMY